MKVALAKNAIDTVLLVDLRLFARAVELGSLTAAAREGGRSATAVTRQLQRLESAIGQRLLHRGGGRFSLTEEGRELLMKLQDPLQALGEAVSAAVRPAGRLAGRLRIAAPYNFGRTVVAPAITGFMALHPEVVMSLELSSRRVDLMADEADIAIRVGDPGSEQLVARRLLTDRIILCAAPGYLDAHAPVRALADLATHRVMDFRPEGLPGTFELTDATGRMQRLAQVAVCFRSNEPDVLALAAQHGQGVAVVPESFVQARLTGGELVHVLPGCGLPAREINALYVNGRRQSPKIRAFLDYLVGIGSAGDGTYGMDR